MHVSYSHVRVISVHARVADFDVVTIPYVPSPLRRFTIHSHESSNHYYECRYIDVDAVISNGFHVRSNMMLNGTKNSSRVMMMVST